MLRFLLLSLVAVYALAVPISKEGRHGHIANDDSENGNIAHQSQKISESGMQLISSREDIKMAVKSENIENLSSSKEQPVESPIQTSNKEIESLPATDKKENIEEKYTLQSENVELPEEPKVVEEFAHVEKQEKLNKPILIEKSIPIEKTLPKEEATIKEDQLPIEEAITAEEPLQMKEEIKAEDTLPIEEAIKTEDTLPIEERKKTEESLPIEESIRAEEPLPIEESIRAEETLPIEEALKAEEPLQIKEEIKSEDALPIEESIIAEDPISLEKPITSVEPMLVEKKIPMKDPVVKHDEIPVEESVPKEESASINKQIQVEEPTLREESIAVDDQISIGSIKQAEELKLEKPAKNTNIIESVEESAIVEKPVYAKEPPNVKDTTIVEELVAVKEESLVEEPIAVEASVSKEGVNLNEKFSAPSIDEESNLTKEKVTVADKTEPEDMKITEYKRDNTTKIAREGTIDANTVSDAANLVKSESSDSIHKTVPEKKIYPKKEPAEILITSESKTISKNVKSSGDLSAVVENIPFVEQETDKENIEDTLPLMKQYIVEEKDVSLLKVVEDKKHEIVSPKQHEDITEDVKKVAEEVNVQLMPQDQQEQIVIDLSAEKSIDSKDVSVAKETIIVTKDNTKISGNELQEQVSDVVEEKSDIVPLQEEKGINKQTNSASKKDLLAINPVIKLSESLPVVEQVDNVDVTLDTLQEEKTKYVSLRQEDNVIAEKDYGSVPEPSLNVEHVESNEKKFKQEPVETVEKEISPEFKESEETKDILAIEEQQQVLETKNIAEIKNNILENEKEQITKESAKNSDTPLPKELEEPVIEDVINPMLKISKDDLQPEANIDNLKEDGPIYVPQNKEVLEVSKEFTASESQQETDSKTAILSNSEAEIVEEKQKTAEPDKREPVKQEIEKTKKLPEQVKEQEKETKLIIEPEVKTSSKEVTSNDKSNSESSAPKTIQITQVLENIPKNSENTFKSVIVEETKNQVKAVSKQNTEEEIKSIEAEIVGDSSNIYNEAFIDNKAEANVEEIQSGPITIESEENSQADSKKVETQIIKEKQSNIDAPLRSTLQQDESNIKKSDIPLNDIEKDTILQSDTIDPVIRTVEEKLIKESVLPKEVKSETSEKVAQKAEVAELIDDIPIVKKSDDTVKDLDLSGPKETIQEIHIHTDIDNTHPANNEPIDTEKEVTADQPKVESPSLAETLAEEVIHQQVRDAEAETIEEPLETTKVEDSKGVVTMEEIIQDTVGESVLGAALKSNPAITAEKSPIQIVQEESIKIERTEPETQETIYRKEEQAIVSKPLEQTITKESNTELEKILPGEPDETDVKSEILREISQKQENEAADMIQKFIKQERKVFPRRRPVRITKHYRPIRPLHIVPRPQKVQKFYRKPFYKTAHQLGLTPLTRRSFQEVYEQNRRFLRHRRA